jgi:hypothetical protein
MKVPVIGTHWLAERLSASQELLEPVEKPTVDPEQSNWTSTFQLQVTASLSSHYGSHGLWQQTNDRCPQRNLGIIVELVASHCWSLCGLKGATFWQFRGMTYWPNPVKVAARSKRLLSAGHIISKTSNELLLEPLGKRLICTLKRQGNKFQMNIREMGLRGGDGLNSLRIVFNGGLLY